MPRARSARASASVRSYASLDSESTRSGVFRETSLSRERFEARRASTCRSSTREGVLDAIGDLTLNLNAEHYSDFGTLTTIGYGPNWRPTD